MPKGVTVIMDTSSIDPAINGPDAGAGGPMPNTTAAPNSQTPGHPSFRRYATFKSSDALQKVLRSGLTQTYDIIDNEHQELARYEEV